MQEKPLVGESAGVNEVSSSCAESACGALMWPEQNQDRRHHNPGEDGGKVAQSV